MVRMQAGGNRGEEGRGIQREEGGPQGFPADTQESSNGTATTTVTLVTTNVGLLSQTLGR